MTPTSQRITKTMTITPTLCAMLQDQLLRDRYVRYLDRSIDLAAREMERNRDDESLRRLSEFYHTNFSDCRFRFLECGGDLLGQFHLRPDQVQRRGVQYPGVELAVQRGEGKLLEAQRLEQRTLFDMEMLREIGYCHGIENYSRHLSGRKPGQNPPTLMDYLPRDAVVIIDESHVTVPQIRGMYPGDRSRKEALVEYGFRLPSAFDNRPLNFDEFAAMVPQTLYVSATPGRYELERAGGRRRGPAAREGLDDLGPDSVAR